MASSCLRTFLDVAELRDQLAKDPRSQHVVNTARFVASYYLGLPLLLPQHTGTELPTLYDWPADKTEADKERLVHADRSIVGNEISERYSQQFPAVTLWLSGNQIEAIYYADHFCDVKSQAMLRFLVDQTLGLQLLHEFCKSLVEGELSDLRVGRSDFANLSTLKQRWQAIVTSSVEIDAIGGTQMVPFLREQLLSEMQCTFAMMPPTVPESTALPRPPVYMLPSTSAQESTEQVNYFRLHVLVHTFANLLRVSNVLVACIDDFCLRFGPQLSVESVSNMSPSFNAGSMGASAEWMNSFAKFLLLIMLLVERDLFSLQKRCNAMSEDASIIMNRYKTLLLLMGDKYLHENIERWLEDADVDDVKHICSFFDYLRSTPSTTSTRSEYVAKNMHLWTHDFLNKAVLASNSSRLPPTDVEQLPATQKIQVSRQVISRAEFLAEHWSYPLTYGKQCIGMSLFLNPNRLVCCEMQQTNKDLSQSQSVSASRKLRRDERTTTKILEKIGDVHPVHEHISEQIPEFDDLHLKKGITEASLDSRNSARSGIWAEDKNLKTEQEHRKIERRLNDEISALERKAARISVYIRSSRESVTRNSNPTSRSKESGILEDGGSDGDVPVGDHDEELFSLPNSAFVNDEIHSLDSSRSPDRPNIEPLNLGLLTPQPDVRSHARVNLSVSHEESFRSPIALKSPDTGFYEENLPDWLKLIPVEKPQSLLRLQAHFSPNHTEVRCDKNSEISLKSTSKKSSSEKNSSPMEPSEVSRKFELVTVMPSYHLHLLRDDG
uniref:Uncharacterized protein n=1 Tax=Parascaris univalens TaxID=6257 RepID=A0A915AF67_PARUN